MKPATPPRRLPSRGTRFLLLTFLVLLAVSIWPTVGQPQGKDKLFLAPLNVEPQLLAKDASVKFDYDIIYVRTPRDPKKTMMFTEGTSRASNARSPSEF